jgi:hypothetical protein
MPRGYSCPSRCGEDRESLVEQYVTTLKDSSSRRAFEIALLAEFSMIAPQLAFAAASADSPTERTAAASCLGWWDIRLRESVALWHQVFT